MVFVVIPLFAPGSLIVLESLSFTDTLYAFDFDGTLAKIVNNPSEAHLTSTTEGLMHRLCELVPVAIVSGRSVADLRSRISFRPKYLIGNHGLEGLSSAADSMAQARSVCESWKNTLELTKFVNGVEIEDKEFSLAIHFRRCLNKSLARRQITDAVKAMSPLPRLIGGKSAVNLLPPGAHHKGSAILDLVQKAPYKHIFYIGDDDTDEDIFALPYTGGQLLSVRVGKKQSSKAGYYIERQPEINKVLRLIIEHHSVTTAE